MGPGMPGMGGLLPFPNDEFNLPRLPAERVGPGLLGGVFDFLDKLPRVQVQTPRFSARVGRSKTERLLDDLLRGQVNDLAMTPTTDDEDPYKGILNAMGSKWFGPGIGTFASIGAGRIQ